MCLHDPNKPWFAATDIGTVRQKDGRPWVLDRIADDQAAEFSPSVVAADSGTTLAAWERVSGDTSDANDPGQIAPHLEIVTAWFDPNTTADCELYLLWTANGAWQTAIQLTSDFTEDAMPTLVAPDGVPTCVWNADGVLVYSHLHDWNPRPVYREYTLANEVPSLDGVTMPGGAAIAYTVQGPNGVDIVASFFGGASAKAFGPDAATHPLTEGRWAGFSHTL